jgi:ribosomal protein S18 acetylase RimI-like enzyme
LERRFGDLLPHTKAGRRHEELDEAVKAIGGNVFWRSGRRGQVCPESGEGCFEGIPAFMNGTEIRQLNAEDAAEYQAVFLGALQSAPAAFAADYGEESARSSDQIAERFRREVIFGAFVDGRLCAIATFLQQTALKRRHVGMIWNMYVSEERRGTGLADVLFKYVLESASLKVDQVELYVAVDNPRGSKFYRRFGFESYGVMPRALRVQGADFDALMMVKKFR